MDELHQKLINLTLVSQERIQLYEGHFHKCSSELPFKECKDCYSLWKAATDRWQALMLDLTTNYEAKRK